MILYDEVYFEITVSGTKSAVKKFVKYIKGGALDDFFEMSNDFITYDDDFAEKEEEELTEIVFANDDFGIEVSKFETDDFLDVFCKESESLDVSGHVYDINDDEYAFTSAKGCIDYCNAHVASKFNDELDELAESEYGEDY